MHLFFHKIISGILSKPSYTEDQTTFLTSHAKEAITGKAYTVLRSEDIVGWRDVPDSKIKTEITKWLTSLIKSSLALYESELKSLLSQDIRFPTKITLKTLRAYQENLMRVRPRVRPKEFFTMAEDLYRRYTSLVANQKNILSRVTTYFTNSTNPNAVKNFKQACVLFENLAPDEQATFIHNFFDGRELSKLFSATENDQCGLELVPTAEATLQKLIDTRGNRASDTSTETPFLEYLQTVRKELLIAAISKVIHKLGTPSDKKEFAPRTQQILGGCMMKTLDTNAPQLGLAIIEQDLNRYIDWGDHDQLTAFIEHAIKDFEEQWPKKLREATQTFLKLTLEKAYKIPCDEKSLALCTVIFSGLDDYPVDPKTHIPLANDAITTHFLTHFGIIKIPTDYPLQELIQKRILSRDTIEKNLLEFLHVFPNISLTEEYVFPGTPSFCILDLIIESTDPLLKDKQESLFSDYFSHRLNLIDQEKASFFDGASTFSREQTIKILQRNPEHPPLISERYLSHFSTKAQPLIMAELLRQHETLSWASYEQAQISSCAHYVASSIEVYNINSLSPSLPFLAPHFSLDDCLRFLDNFKNNMNPDTEKLILDRLLDTLQGTTCDSPKAFQILFSLIQYTPKKTLLGNTPFISLINSAPHSDSKNTLLSRVVLKCELTTLDSIKEFFPSITCDALHTGFALSIERCYPDSVTDFIGILSQYTEICTKEDICTILQKGLPLLIERIFKKNDTAEKYELLNHLPQIAPLFLGKPPTFLNTHLLDLLERIEWATDLEHPFSNDSISYLNKLATTAEQKLAVFKLFLHTPAHICPSQDLADTLSDEHYEALINSISFIGETPFALLQKVGQLILILSDSNPTIVQQRFLELFTKSALSKSYIENTDINSDWLLSIMRNQNPSTQQAIFQSYLNHLQMNNKSILSTSLKDLSWFTQGPVALREMMLKTFFGVLNSTPSNTCPSTTLNRLQILSNINKAITHTNPSTELLDTVFTTFKTILKQPISTSNTGVDLRLFFENELRPFLLSANLEPHTRRDYYKKLKALKKEFHPLFKGIPITKYMLQKQPI